MSPRVSETPTARRQADALRGRVARSYDLAVERLAAEGCAAADYRLTGDMVDRICCLHLYGRWRTLVCFPEEDRVAVVLIAEHDRGEDDAYGSLYGLLGIPEPSRRRTKPPCCEEDGTSPVDEEVVDRLALAAKALRRRRG